MEVREPSVIKQKRPQQIESTIDRIINISEHVIDILKTNEQFSETDTT